MTAENELPAWYSGPQGILRNVLQRAERESRRPYQRYTRQRVASFSPLQRAAFTRAEQEVTNPAYQNMYDRVEPALTASVQDPTINANRYMNPYNTQVIDNIAQLGARNLSEYILPQVRDRFIRSGQYGSTGHQSLTNRAIRDTQEAVSRAQSEALQSGYNRAMETSINQQARNLQLANQIPNIAGSMQQNRMAATNNLAAIGSQQQAREQEILNQAHQEFLSELNYPQQQTEALASIVRGIPVSPSAYRASYQPRPPQPSIYSQLGGTLMGLYGQMQQPQSFAKGGHVKKIRHYAEGGAINPIQRGINDALETKEIQSNNRNIMQQQAIPPQYMQGEYAQDLDSMRQLAERMRRPNRDPFWSAFSRIGLQMAARKNAGNFMADLGDAAIAGMDEYNRELANQESRVLQGANLENLIGKTHRLMADAKRKEELEKLRHLDATNFRNRQLALQEKQLDINSLINIQKQETKNPLNLLHKKANEKALEQISNSFSSLPALKSSLHDLESIAKKLDTGAIKGSLAKTNTTLGSAIGVGEAADIENFDSLTNQLVLDLGDQLKGSSVAMGKLKMIEATKPSLMKGKKANLDIIKHMKDVIKIAEDKNAFVLKVINEGGNAADAQLAYNKYLDAKEEYENTHKDKFAPKPEDFLSNEYEDMTRLPAAVENSGISVKTSEEETPDFNRYSIEEIEKALKELEGGEE